MDLAATADSLEQLAVGSGLAWQPEKIDLKYSEATIKYDTDYSFDIAQSSVAYDPVYGSIGGFQAAISDILGNKAFHFLLTNTAETKDELLTAFNVGVTYINKERRLNWGVGVFHLYDEYFNDVDLYYDERQAGVLSLLSYPLSKFHRVELTNVARYSNKERRYGLPNRESFLLSHYRRWVYDNSLWDVSGPIEGRRYSITLGITNSLSELRNYNRLAAADIRHYIRLGRFSAFASRLFAYTSPGLEPQRIYLGGSWSFRGYDRRAFYNSNVLFASNELRFPLIDDLLIGFPFGGLGFRGIRGALFFDVGSAWDDDFDQFYGSFGAGFRVNLGYVVVLRFDFSRTTDFEKISSRTDFDFFFGWNF
jgi:outer membrane protein assembly factor BamA